MINWDGNFLCEKGYYINLNRRTDRRENCELELNNAKITGVERFEAVEFSKDLYYHDKGCTQSHMNIAKLQIENNWQYVLYLEDDIVFDVMYNVDIRDSGKKLDYSKIVKNVIKDLYKIKPDILWLGTRLEAPVKEKVSNTMLVPGRTLMAHAYLGSLKYANFVIDNLRYIDNTHFSGGYPIDWFIDQINEKNCGNLVTVNNFLGKEAMLNNDLKVVVSVPQFFVQGVGLSNISNTYVDYRRWSSDAFSQYSRIEELEITPYYE